MLEIVVRAAIATLLLAFVVQLGLWALRVRQPKLLLSAWAAVLIASMAMPAISSQMSRLGAAAALALAPHQIFAGSKWLTGIYLLVAALLLLRLSRGLALSWRMLRATQPVAADWVAGTMVRTSIRTCTWIGAPVTIGVNLLLLGARRLLCAGFIGDSPVGLLVQPAGLVVALEADCASRTGER